MRNRAITVTALALFVTPSIFAQVDKDIRFQKKEPLKASPKLKNLDPKYTQNPLKITDVIEIAYDLNPELAQANSLLSVFRGKVSEVKSSLAPSVTAGRNETLVAHKTEPGDLIQLTVPLDISGSINAAVDQAQFDALGARLNVNRVSNDLEYRVINSFLFALRTQALLKVADRDVQNSEERLKDAKTRYEARTVAYLDVLRAETDLAVSQRRQIAAQSAVRSAIVTLAQTIGVDSSENLKISDEPSGAVPQKIPDQPSAPSEMQDPANRPEFTAALNEALKNRPEILQGDTAIAAAKKGITVARRSELPSAQFGVGYFDQRSVTGTRYREPQAFLSFSLPIFDGGLSRARQAEATALLDSAISFKRQQTEGVKSEVLQSFLVIDQANSQITVARTALTQAKEAFDLAKVRYNAGVASHTGLSPLLEVSDAEAALTLAEENELNAEYDFRSAIAMLDHARGAFAYSNQTAGFAVVPTIRTSGSGR